MDYELRKINSKDIMPVVKIINKMGVKELRNSIDKDKIMNVVNSTNEKGNNDLYTYLGASFLLDVVTIIMENLPKCEKELFSFVASMVGKEAKEIEDLPPSEFVELIQKIITKDEFKDFIKVVSRFLKWD